MKVQPIEVNKIRDELPGWFKRRTCHELDLDRPSTFNEKIQWLKLYDSTPIKTRLADKYLVREWIKEKIGEKYLIPLLGRYDCYDDIDFDSLPDRFVIKCNHGSAWNIIVKDKNALNLEDTKAKLDAWVNTNYAFRSYEFHYRDIHPQIIIEKYLYKTEVVFYEYHFYCFSGCVEQIWLDINTADDHKRKIYDKYWNELDMVVKLPRLETDIPKPDNLDVMLELAEKLSDGFPHVRVDFYRLDDGTIYFGEMTFTPASGTVELPPSENVKLGSLIELPELAYDVDSGVYYKERELRFFRKQFAYDFERITENKLTVYGEKQTHTLKSLLDTQTNQLAQGTEDALKNKLDEQAKQLALKIETIVDDKLNVHDRQLANKIDIIFKDKLDSYKSQLSQDFDEGIAEHAKNITKYHKFTEDSLREIKEAILLTSENIIKASENQQQLAENKMQQECAMLRREMNQNLEQTRKLLRELSQYGRYKRLYRWYKILHYITFGKRRRHYKKKAADYKQRIRNIRYYIING